MFGIDVSNDFFDVALHRKSRSVYAQFPQTPQGYDECLGWMNKYDQHNQMPAVMEHTGKLWIPLAAALDKAGRKVAVLPSDVLTQGVRQMYRVTHKTDKQDALLLSRYASFLQAQGQLKLLSVLSPQRQALLETQRYVSSLVQDLSGKKMSLNQAICDHLKVLLQQDIDHLSQRIATLRQGMAQTLKQSPELDHIDQLLQSIPGIGPNTSLVLITEIGDISRFESAKQLAAWVALSPVLQQSGKRSGASRIRPGGNRYIRKGLFNCAPAASRYNPMVRDMRLRLQGKDEQGQSEQDEQGKQGEQAKQRKTKRLSDMQIRVALAHKLIRQVYGVWSSGKEFDPEYLKKRRQARVETEKVSQTA